MKPHSANKAPQRNGARTRVGKVLAQQLILLHLEAGLDELHGLVTTHRHKRRNFLISADAEAADGVPRLAVHWLLPCQLL